MDRLLLDTVTNPNWFPLRFNVETDQLQFVEIAPEAHRAATFLTDIRPSVSGVRPVPRSEVARVPMSEAPLHLILHSGLGGSTLLARALGQSRVVTTLKEPPILTDVVAFGLRGGSVEDSRQLLRDVARLLSRPFVPGEGLVIKMSSVGNGLGLAIAEDRAQTRILCLQTPLDLMLASLASRGEEGRTAGRRLFTGLRNARMVAVEPAGDHDDLQLAALAWLSIQKMMLDAAARFGSERVRSISSERLMVQPRETLAAVAAHFRLALDVDARLASGIFERHAKTGQPFDAQKRVRGLQATLREHGVEIQAIVDWARKVADANRIAWDLPDPLVG
jgi:hypothetical protein